MDPPNGGFFVWGLLSDEASKRYGETGRLNTADLNTGGNIWVFYMASKRPVETARKAQRFLSQRYPNAVARSRRHWKDGRTQEWKRYER